MKYLDFLDGLRAIAVASVVLYHLDASWVPNGYLGVDIFFVISGFIVSYSVAGREKLPFHRLVADFYARRFIRILPALIVCVLLTGLVSALFIPDAWLSSGHDRVGLYALFGLSNVELSRGTDYFSPVTEFNPFTHTWSLGVEEQFYLLFPLLFFPWFLKRGKLISFLAYLLAFVVSAIIWYRLSVSAPLQAFYMIYSRFWELAAGVLCFEATQVLRRHRFVTPASAAVTSAGLALLAFCLFYRPAPNAAWISNAAAVAGTVAIIASLRDRNISATAFAPLQAGPVRFIGKISYSLYLWHWPVFVLTRWTTGLETVAELTVSLAIAMGLSVLSYRFVETPVRHSRALFRLPRYATALGGLACIGVAWLALHTVVLNKDAISLSTVTRHKLDWKADIARPTFEDLPGCIALPQVEGIALRFIRGGCGGSSEGRRVYFLGDSHSYVLQNLMRRFTLITGVESVLVTTAGCTFLSLQLERDIDPGCAAPTAAAVRHLQTHLKAGDLVFLPSLRLPRLTEQFRRFSDAAAVNGVYGPGRAEQRSKAIDNAISILRPLADRGAIFLFEAPLPLFRSVSFRCSDWFNSSNPACADGLSIERDFILHLRQPTMSGFARIAETIPQVDVWDPLPVLCPDEMCHMFRGDKPLFSDGDHISAYSTILLTPAFVAAATKALSGQPPPAGRLRSAGGP